MRCPKCAFENVERSPECTACGIVFAKLRAPDPIDDPPADLADLDFGEDCDAGEDEGFDKQPVIAMLIGAALAYWTLHSPLLYRSRT